MFADFLNNMILYPFFMVSVRLTGIFLTVPPFSDKVVSVRIRVVILLVLSLALSPVVSHYIPAEPNSVSLVTLVILKEFLIGLLLGISVRLFFFAINVAGDFMSATMGLQSASMLDPSTKTNTAAIGRILQMAALVIFLSLNMHLYMIEAFVESYNLVKFNTTLDIGTVMYSLIAVVTKIFILGIKMASPVVVANYIINISLGVLNRLVPQIHVFFISMPLTMLVGTFILLLSLSSMLILFTEEIEDNMVIFSQEIN
ncbi:MAG: flagellar biosynthetic protein FliR [Proteobacteria bacterium]|nr:flagellar biosynthetic protein FliR [Pseudomonadota bacterium]